MSVLIKGMKMPSCCGKCPFMYSGFYKGKSYPCVCYAKAQPMLIKPSEMDMRDGLCPLVEIPKPHGDLIDRDAFRADFSMGENCDKCGIELRRCEYDRIYTKMDFCGWLDDAPVIIEEEGSED